MGFLFPLLLVLLFHVCAPTEGRTVVEIRFKKFDSKSRIFTGQPCDEADSPNNQCDPQFKFCVDKMAGDDNSNNCEYLKDKSKQFPDSNVIKFKKKMNGVRNPIVVTMDEYEGIRLKIDVSDFNEGLANDDLDAFDWEFDYAPQRNSDESTKHSEVLRGKRRRKKSKMQLYVKVYCDEHWYTDNCTVYCHPADDDFRGHYSCNTSTGEKVCLEGWGGDGCLRWWNDCTEVSCANGGTCVDGDNSFQCFCPPEFTGSTCGVPVNYCEFNPCFDENGFSLETLWWADCGQSRYSDAGTFSVTSKIVGGISARPNEFPWLVSLQYPPGGHLNHHFCAGTIIHPLWILTAAHCFDHIQDVSYIRVLVGEYNLSRSDGIEKSHTVKRKVQHSYYGIGHQLNNDIALLLLNEPITFTENVKPVCEPMNDTYINVVTQASGWGYLGYEDFFGQPTNPIRSDELRWVKLKTLSNDECENDLRAVWNRHYITENMICAGYRNYKTRDTCVGDSGGSLTTQDDNGNFHIVGIVSWGDGCAESAPGVYTRVTEFKEWVKNELNLHTPPEFY